jgi:hypothetical protein
MMRCASWLVVCAGLASACQPAEPKAVPSPPAAAVPAAPEDSAPNANAARYGPHGVAVTPSPGNTAPPSKEAKPEIEPGPLAGAAAAPSPPPGSPPSSDEATAEMRGHPCQCGKTCHCGHCSGAVPGCHCHVKRADGKDSE